MGDEKAPTENDGGWTVVEGRASKKEKGKGVSKFDSDDLVSFYVTNLPNACRKEWLAEAVAGFGELADTFNARRPNKVGNVFGFVKFRGVKDKWELERRMRGITVGVMRARVNLQKFDRSGKPVVREEPPLRSKPDVFPSRVVNPGGCDVRPGKSFVEAVSGERSPKGTACVRSRKWRRRQLDHAGANNMLGRMDVPSTSILGSRAFENLDGLRVMGNSDSVGRDYVIKPSKRTKNSLDEVDLNFFPIPPVVKVAVLEKPKHVLRRGRSNKGKTSSGDGCHLNFEFHGFGNCRLQEGGGLVSDEVQKQKDLALANEVINSLHAAALVGIQIIDCEERVRDMILEDGVIEEVA
ncbi:hypothetical protein SSX86_001209 [Deinandra increscens subsp. villosa]|uniref:RRM domain-containing protein n=1 Tax=Deinandra increscens subsp. villosa TaxID=3103831 RepID=A0AAP0DUX6_9ASTR